MTENTENSETAKPASGSEPTQTFTSGDGVFREDRTSLKDRIWDAWRDMRASTRRMIAENPSEARLLFFVLMSDLILFLSFAVKTVVSPNSVMSSILPDNVALLLVVALLFRTLSVYVFALVVSLILRIFGGTGTFRATRIGIFWGTFVAAPFELFSAVITFFMARLEGVMPFLGGEMISLAPLWIGLLPYVWFVSAGATEAHGFKKVFPLFVSMSILSIISIVAMMILRARGVI